jgi:CSLREA domain-containing protein
VGRGRLAKPALAAGVTLAALAAAPAASADFFHVTKHGDHAPGPCTKADCTLREPILAANANPGRDRILLPTKRSYHGGGIHTSANLTLDNCILRGTTLVA